jgi:hypothetical protein
MLNNPAIYKNVILKAVRMQKKRNYSILMYNAGTLSVSRLHCDVSQVVGCHIAEGLPTASKS